jgi:uncharacterized membrane protein YedE/YeeE
MLRAMTTTILGGILIGGAAGALFALAGRIAGVSGILAGGLDPAAPERGWRLLFVAGLVTGGALAGALLPGTLPAAYAFSTPRLAAAGLLVGIGARLANGCTSGHGLCGVARGAPRSLLALAVFTASGALTVFVGRVLGG